MRKDPPSPCDFGALARLLLTPYFTREPVRSCILPCDFACFTRAASRDEAVRSFAKAGSALSLSMAGGWTRGSSSLQRARKRKPPHPDPLPQRRRGDRFRCAWAHRGKWVETKSNEDEE